MWNRRITRRQTFRLSLFALGAMLTAWITPSKPAHAGYGACSTDDGCTAYMDPPNGDICANCGHNYTMHY